MSHVNSPAAVPYTIREALFGNHGLESCVSSIQHQWNQSVHARLTLFLPIIDRPKQAIQHLFELFILHVCRMDTSWNEQWVSSLVNYLAPVSQHVIPAIQPCKSIQWYGLEFDTRGRPVSKVPKFEEYYPKHQIIPSKRILDVISHYSKSFQEDDIAKTDLTRMIGLMDEPAKTAVIGYAWFLNSQGVKNGWLRPYLHASLGRRELSHSPVSTASAKKDPTVDSRIGRVEEELHTLFSLPFFDNQGHLVWYTVRTASPGEIVGRLASSYARSNHVRIHSSKDLSKSVQIHYSHVCNFNSLDFRLWESWTNHARGVGPFRSLAKTNLSLRVVRFDRPVLLEDALAVGFRVVHGHLINPSGIRMLVVLTSNGMYKAIEHPLRVRKQEPFAWVPRMKFT